MNTNFYKEVGESFSETRQHPWDGWKLCKKYIKPGSKVLDIGCGNQRFSKFVSDCDVVGIDNSFEADVRLDIVQALLDNNMPEINCDVCVAFGLMHHIPDYELRVQLIEYMLKCGDIAIVTFWQMSDKVLSKAESLGNNDYLLGWQDADVRRFCHNFLNEEIGSLPFEILDDFVADGQNRYLVFNR
ncbi:MAG: class I SAM-dependent methyltransferase [Coriobacteriia bacterium]|nr:class I SAM-dependent methyltransferase [Coriobacteriia bacterium]